MNAKPDVCLKENTPITGGKRRRISQLHPELRREIPALFDRGMAAERIGEQFALPTLQIIEEVVRDMRMSRRPMALAGNVIPMRRTA